ncbi:hypothetical protein NDI39_10015 [Microcoleus sp. ZQ-A2]|nr:hypothetical protein [Microcoleus sp. FACHB-1]
MNHQYNTAPDYDPTEFPPLILLEQGDVDVWVRRRGAFLLRKSQETAKDCEAGKLASTATIAASVVMSSNPLVWIPLTIGIAGYVHTIFQEFQDTGSIRLIPMYRGKLADLLWGLEGNKVESRHPLEDQIEYLSEAEKDEVLLINYRFADIATVLNSAPPKVRFDLYRHLCGQFHARRDIITGDEVKHYISSAVSEARRAIPAPPESVIASGTSEPISLPAPADTPESAIASGTGEPTPADVSELAIASGTGESISADDRPPYSQVSGEIGLEILQHFAATRRSTLLVGDTGAGKSISQAYMLYLLFDSHPEVEVFVLCQKADSFGGLAQQGRVTLFDPIQPQEALLLIHSIWLIYDQRRRLPEDERPQLSPVRLILADWLSINKALGESKGEEPIKSSKYLTKLADIIYNGRELNVCLIVDLQSYNLKALGLDADKNTRKNFNLIGLGNYSIDELGLVNDSYGVLTNLIADHYIIPNESERASLVDTFNTLHPISKESHRPIIFNGSSPARLALLPDLRPFKAKKFALKKQTVTPSDSVTHEEIEPPSEVKPMSDLNVSDVLTNQLGEPLKTIWLFTKKQSDWVTAREIQRKDFPILKGKGIEQIHQYLGLLADSGYGEIDEQGKSHSSVRFKAH